MAQFSLIMPGEGGPGWADAFWWNILPAVIGNILGGAVFVAIPFGYIVRKRQNNSEDKHSSSRQAS